MSILPRRTKTCQHCGAQFSDRPVDLERRNYCSRKCISEAKRAVKRESCRFFLDEEHPYALIPLSKGYFAKADPQDAGHLMQFLWNARVPKLDGRGSTKIYAARGIYIPPDKHNTQFMHREIMQPPDGMFVDHIDGDGLNNRRYNLRLCSKAQNGHNRGVTKLNTSGHKGVHWFKLASRWQAYITANGKRIHIGYFSTAEEAAKARDDAERKMFGKFARLNFEDTTT